MRTTSFTGPVGTIRGGIGRSIAARYLAWVPSGVVPIAAARRARPAWRFVSTGKREPFTRSNRRTGRRPASRSSFTTSAVSSYAGSTSFETMRKSSGFRRLTKSRKLLRSCAMFDLPVQSL